MHRSRFSPENTIYLVGERHRKQFDLINLSSCYNDFRFDFAENASVSSFTTLCTELTAPGSIICSSFLRSLDNKLVFKRFLREMNILTPEWYSETAPIEFYGILKPVDGSGSRGIYTKKMQVGESIPKGFICERFYHDIKSVCVGFYFYKGILRNWITWERTHTFPTSGGPSTGAISTTNNELLGQAESFLGCIPTSMLEGVFMLEYIYHQNNHLLLEINPRPWGSIALLELNTRNFFRNMCYDYLGYFPSLGHSYNYSISSFVNPILANPIDTATASLKGGTFFSGFTYASPRTLFLYLYSYMNISSILKLLSKLFRV
jgi:hypothetical protein